MSFKDKLLQCSDCGTTFTFSAEEQGQFASKGHTNNPKRCLSCRQKRKARQNTSNGNSYRNNSYGNNSYGNRPQREMFSAVCAECRKTTQVPFKPSEDRPVYCSDCYNKVRLSRSR